ncbi:Fungalysin metallopeptidase-domain-containing protein [Gymnopilus junonius]|uniref:Extracellular metalloproteinase n=1 Tax=Gymnopilus junonius TaxID=109634 RepID=A0A9P5NUP0_GYMJU|nr:Fungalysin metallopeptidase-domain-containing protein [Gymnopilus junonius]
MRCFFTASLVIASLAGYVYGHRQVAPSAQDEGRVGYRRKSLGFGPEHPHAVFRSSPFQVTTNGFTPQDASMDPLDIARIFVEDVLIGQAATGSSYKIRSDSYTDKNTGVTHVYVRQLVNGLEVADGDMNINIKDGMVLSYGNSFFNGIAPEPFSNPAINTLRDPRQEACDQLFQSFTNLQRANVVDSEQIIMAQASRSDEATHELQHLLESNCAPVELAEHHFSEDIADFRPALLKFMATATPDPKLALDITDRFEHHRDSMIITPTSHFAPSLGEHSVEFTVDNVPDSVNPVKAKLAYIQVPNKAGDMTELHLVWKFEVEMQDNWYEAAVSASAPHQIISVVDWASDAPVPKPPQVAPATYNVFKWGINDPSVGNRSIEKENYDVLASPIGWHSVPFANDPSFKGAVPQKEFYRNTTTTWGNNVFAQENWEGQNAFISNYRPDAGNDRSFHYTYDPQETERPDAMDEAQKYINTTIAQLFYTTNLVHDLYYRYGFDEVSGNFQQYNFGRGGAQNDAVIANAQDGSGFNNANFMTPPDAGIVIHELSHGLSTRLTGGPANSGCLGWGEAGGMGEGWGDFLATTIRSNRNYSDYAMGSWAANREQGIRNYPYSLNETVNPSTYKTLDKPGYWGVHAIGEVWAEILWVVANKLIEKHGFSHDLFPPAPLEDGTVPTDHFYREDKKASLVPRHGNSLIVQLVINGMKLQTCRPSFFDARDAIIQADQVLTGGENFCELWDGFAARGLGQDATVRNRTPWVEESGLTDTLFLGLPKLKRKREDIL